MKALVYDGPNSLAYRDEPNPSPEADDLIVRVHAVRQMVQVVRVSDEIRRYHAG